ncbi:energy-coupled thiamine transporter ThiT [Peribacillus sp. SCS-37]|uniref:energy-coupled thiamine transporter ThiT n=1 Tax=Paraperibacillus esterisolvens TaxID=3115296 RepID=UPI0039063BB1
MGKKLKLNTMIEAAFFAGFAFVLDMLPSIKLGPWISIAIAMVPIFIVAFRWGFKASVAAGFLWGLLQIVLGDADDILSPLQGFIEYFIAFSFIGFAGLFYGPIQKALHGGSKKRALLFISLAVLAGSLARYFWHFLAGIIFWGIYAPDGMSPVLYSLIVNGGTMIGSAVLCALVLNLLIGSAPRIIKQKQTGSNKVSRKAV